MTTLRAGDLDGDGRAEIPVTSPWGLGVLELTGTSLTSPVMAANGTRFGGWLLNTADNRFGPVGDFDGDGRVEMLVTSPWGIGVFKLSGHMFVAMDQVYGAVGLRVQRVFTERLNLPTLTDVDVGARTLGTVTAEQTQLFGNRNGVGTSDVVVYFVRSTVPPYNGCAAHPTGRPGAVVVQGATRWTMAHEIGHVLGFSHVNDNNRLMTGLGTANITNPPPDLIAQEVNEMRENVLTTTA